MIFFFEIGVVLVILFVLFMMLVSISRFAIGWLANGIWIIAAILALAHIISLVVNIVRYEKNTKKTQKLPYKIIGNTMCITGTIIRIFTETIILFCILGGFNLRANIEGFPFVNWILAILGFIINVIILSGLLFASFFIDAICYDESDEINYLLKGLISIGASTFLFFLSQVLMGFGNQEIMNTLFDNIPIIKELYFLLFIVL